MAITPISLSRISFHQRSYNLLESMRTNQTDIHREQNHIATGLRFVLPSEDPLRSSASSTFDRRLDEIDLVKRNVESARGVLTEVDSTMQDALNLLTEAQRLAVQSVGDTISEEERHALVTVVNSIIDQMVDLGNRQYLNTYLFSGHEGEAPFELSHDGVIYRGDGNRMETIVDTDMSEDAFTVPGLEFFQAASARLKGAADLDPALTADTRIVDLDGAVGQGVTLGRVVVTYEGSATEIDLSGADTVGDVVDILNANLPAGVTANLGTRGIRIDQGGPGRGDATIAEIGDGRTATDLGILATFTPVRVAGGDLNPRVTPRTELASLHAGAGADLSDGIIIRNGVNEAKVDLGKAETVEDVLNAINNADVGVWARLADDGKRLELVNRVSGTDMVVEENGGTAATLLGIRSMNATTTLAELNDGLGVRTTAGDDFSITTASGASFSIDVDGAVTLQDLVNRINARAGGAVTASFTATGNGLQITDNTAGGGTLQLERLSGSFAMVDLGLDTPAVGNTVTGRDVNPIRVDSPFTGLLELQEGMISDDRQQMTIAGDRIDRVIKAMQQVQGEMASQAQMIDRRFDRVEAEEAATKILQSDVRDADVTESIVRFQQLQMALQANMMTATKVMNLSLLDYLR